MNALAIAATVLTALTSMTVPAAEVYKHVDAQGRVTFSDHPVANGAEKVEVQVPEANAAEAARLSREQAMITADDHRRTTKKAEEQRTAAKKESEQQARQQRCETARNRYVLLRDNNRVFKRDAQGNPVYYSASDMDAQRAAAKVTMDTACGS